MRGRRDLCCLTLGPMIAPQVVLAERLQVFANCNHGGTGSIDSNGLYLVARDTGFLHGLPSGGGQSAHMVFVRLGGVFGVFALAVQRIFGDGGFQQAALAVNDRDADAQRPEVDSSHNGHYQAPLFPGC
jgi:hypothetical protein